MSPSEMKRLTLYEKLIDVLGEEPAVTLMENLPPGGWDQVASKADLQALKAEVNAKIDTGFAEVNAKMDVGFAKMDGQFAEFRGEFAEFRGELRGEMKAMEGRMDRRAGRDIRLVTFMMMGVAISIWVALLVNPIG